MHIGPGHSQVFNKVKGFSQLMSHYHIKKVFFFFFKPIWPCDRYI